MTANVQAIAGEVSTVDEAVLKALPFISTALGFIPQAAVAVPFMPLVGGAARSGGQCRQGGRSWQHRRGGTGCHH